MTAPLFGVVLMVLGTVLTIGGVLIRVRGDEPTSISLGAWGVFGLGIWLALSTPGRASAEMETFQRWSFDKPPANPANIAPDINANTAPGAPPFARAAGTGYSDQILGQQGVLIVPPEVGQVGFDIPDFLDPNATKVVGLNLVYRIGLAPAGGQLGFGDLPFVQGFNGMLISDTMFNNQNWRFLQMSYEKSGCPARETLIIPGATINDFFLIDSVSVLTNCVPEPSTLVLGSIGVLTGFGAWLWKCWRAAA